MTVVGESDQFVIYRLRAKPVEYSVRIRHFVSGGEWMMGVTVYDVAESDRAKLAVVDDLRRAIEIFEEEKSSTELRREWLAQRNGYLPPPLERDCPPRPASGCCEACGAGVGIAELRLDHDHYTGKFRGWTCQRCNVGIGVLGDTVDDLKRALSYLLRHYAPEYSL